MCANVSPAPPFTDGFGFSLGSGIVTVTASTGAPVSLGGKENPTGFFMLEWNVQDFDAASTASVVFNDANSEFMTLTGPNSPVLNRTIKICA